MGRIAPPAARSIETMPDKPDEPQRVSMGPCSCPGAPHGEDVAWMHFEKAARAYQADAHSGEGEQGPDRWLFSLEAAITEGLVAWNLTDADGEPLPLREAVEDFSKGWPLGAWFSSRVWDLLEQPLWRVGGISLGEGDRGDADDGGSTRPN